MCNPHLFQKYCASFITSEASIVLVSHVSEGSLCRGEEVLSPAPAQGLQMEGLEHFLGATSLGGGGLLGYHDAPFLWIPTVPILSGVLEILGTSEHPFLGPNMGDMQGESSERH